jgi:hypothetical protein
VAGRRHALIVASDEYEHEGMRRLLAPAADAEALSRVLGDPQIGAFDVQVVHNEPAHVIQGQIEDLFSESRPDDVLLLHFSCHGLKSQSGELFFAARNTRPNRLGSTAVSADFVQRCMRASRSRSIVLLLDCCYGGAFAQGVTVRAAGDVHVLDSFPSGKLSGGRGRAVITASSSMEYAFEDEALADDQSRRPSVFTTAVVEGLATGDADRDEDGWVSLNELYDYVFDRVREQNPHQTPSRDVEMQGELYVARSRRRRIRALPVPPDLEAARTDPNMYSRLGAVGELRSRLASDNLPAALGAHNALTDMARNDIRYVADPAETALRDAAVRPAETELHFGRIAQGSAPPHRTVQLLGPPIARACIPHASHDWIRVDETTEGLDISVDASRAGSLRGSVEVKGPTGEAVITIDVDLLPAPPASPSPPSHEPTDSRITKAPPIPVPRAEEPPVAPSPPRPPAGVASPPGTPSQARTVTPGDVREPTSPVPGSTAMPSGRSRSPAEGGERGRIIPVLWALMPLLSCTVLTPVPFAHAAIRLRDGKLWGITVAYALLWLPLAILNTVANSTGDSEGGSGVTAFLLFVLAGVATVHALRLRRRVFAPPPPATEP